MTTNIGDTEVLELDEPGFNAVLFILAYEDQDDEPLTIEEIADGFQGLIDAGLIFSLQGSYQRAAAALIEEGWCHE